jgi:hypothetical protein
MTSAANAAATRNVHTFSHREWVPGAAEGSENFRREARAPAGRVLAEPVQLNDTAFKTVFVAA